MKQSGCHFVVASGNQYYQLRDLFPEYYDELSFVAENGAFVKDQKQLVFTSDIPKETVDLVIDVCREYPEISNVVCGLNSAYCERGSVDQDFFDLTNIYYHRLQWVDDFKEIKDQILKFAPTVPVDKTYDYYDIFRERLVKRWGILPDQCVAFGDGGNDIEMLKYCEQSYAMENAPQNVKAAAKHVCPSNEEDGVLVTLDQIFA